MSVLARILESKRREIDALRLQRASEARTERTERASDASAPLPRVPHDVGAALRRVSGAPLRLISEVKFHSPSAGLLSRALGCGERAIAYAEAGASMVSVLCDGPFFNGGWHHLSEARARLDARGLAVPLLAKEFVLDELQLASAAQHGADAVLLIARIVSSDRLRQLVSAARALALEPFVEVADERELDVALTAGACTVGVNARDLDTLAIDAARAARVLDAIPRECVAVHLSGLKAPGDLREVAAGRADAALVGEALMRQDDPRPLLGSFLRAARGLD